VGVRRYLSKISGPLLDRVSIYIPVRPVDPERFEEDSGSRRSSAELRDEVVRAVRLQRDRYRGSEAYRRNADIPLYALDGFCPMTEEARNLLDRAQRALRFSGRSRRNIVQVSRTIADLAGDELIGQAHVAEAVQYRVPGDMI
jgi:magnesium chelatase family protein